MMRSDMCLAHSVLGDIFGGEQIGVLLDIDFTVISDNIHPYKTSGD